MADVHKNTAVNGRTLVMGIGNLLLGDEGVGVHAIRELAEVNLPDEVELLDAGIAFTDALAHMEGVSRLIIIDAVKGGQAPGTVYRIQVKRHLDRACRTAIHGLSIIDMMELYQGSLPDGVTILGIEPAVIDWGLEISETVSQSMPLLIDAICSEISPPCEASISVETKH